MARHFLVPRHIVVPEAEKEAVLKMLRATAEQLPRIKKNDPAIKKYKAERGAIIAIQRISTTAGKTIYYRVVE